MTTATATATATSKLEKTIQILEDLSEQQLDMVYSYAQFLSERSAREARPRPRNAAQIVERLAGLIPDRGKSLEEYKEERLAERYGPFD